MVLEQPRGCPEPAVEFLHAERLFVFRIFMPVKTCATSFFQILTINLQLMIGGSFTLAG